MRNVYFGEPRVHSKMMTDEEQGQEGSELEGTWSLSSIGLTSLWTKVPSTCKESDTEVL